MSKTRTKRRVSRESQPPQSPLATTLAQRLTELIPPPTSSEAQAAITGQIAILVQQRDSALRELNDLANMQKTVGMVRDLAGALREAVDELTRAVKAVKTVRNFLQQPAAEEE